MPRGAVLEGFNTLMLDATLSCEGAFDADCDQWDHVISVTANCGRVSEPGATPDELGRWITPYQRRVGHWLTEINPWLAVFLPELQCNITYVATDNGHPWVFDLNLRFTQDEGKHTGRPSSMLPLFNTTVISSFDSNYNNRPILEVVTPPRVCGAQLTAILTGHGDMEFAVSRHVFVINGQMFNVSFMEPLDQWGCAKKVCTFGLVCLIEFIIYAFGICRCLREWNLTEQERFGMDVMVGVMDGLLDPGR